MGILTKEWRELVLGKLAALEETNRKIIDDFSLLRENMPKSTKVEEMEKRVRVLEDFKLKAITIILAVQFLLGILTALAAKFWR